MATIVIISSLCFFLSAIFQLLMFYCRRTINRAFLSSISNKIFFMINPIILLLWANATGGRLEDPEFNAWYISVSIILGMLVYSCLYVLYMPFYYTISHSLSIQTLIRLITALHQKLPLQEVEEMFCSRQLLKRRLDGMCNNEFLSCESQKYRLTGRGRYVAIFFSSVKKFWRLGAGG